MSETDVLKINRWVNILCPKADWNDQNNNSRIDSDELRPAACLSPSEKEEANSNIKNIYVPLIQKIDQNCDGASYDEIETYITPPINIDYDFDLDEVINGLKNEGNYKVPDQPILFATEDNLPEEIKTEVLKTRSLGNHKSEFLNYDCEDGCYTWPTHSGKTKAAIILVSKKWLEKESDVHLKWGLKHELLHAKQWFSGEMDEWDSIVNEMIKSGKFTGHTDLKADLYKVFYFPNTFFELNVNKDLLLEYLKPPVLVEKDDIPSIQYICAEMNANLAKINGVISVCYLNNAEELVPLINGILEEAFPQTEIDELNKYLGDLVKDDVELKKKYQIYRNITADEYNALYDLKK